MISIRNFRSIILILMTMISCSKSENTADVIDSYVDLYFKDSNGNDLLDQNFVESSNKDLFSVYYVINGQEKVVSNSNLDASQGFLIFPPEGTRDSFFMRLFLNIESQEDTTTTILRYNGSTSDIFLAEINNGDGRDSNMTVVTKLWLNDTLIYNSELQKRSERLYTIVRN